MSALTFLKLGGSLITDKTRPLTPRFETLARLAEEIHAADLEGSLVVGHGSGSFGHVTAAQHEIHLGVRTPEQVAGVAATQVHAHRLHRLVVETLWKEGSRPFSFAPSGSVMAAAGEPGSFEIAPLLAAIELGLLPVTFGDVVMDSEWGASICSTEQAFELLAAQLAEEGYRVGRVLWLGETDGVYDGNGETISEIAAGDAAGVAQRISGAAGEDVTGGMRLRLDTAGRLAERGVTSWILNGVEPDLLRAALVGEPTSGTRVVPD